MDELNLPGDTRVLTDDHYRLPDVRPRRSRKQEEEDWES